jgi:hypothetical protein
MRCQAEESVMELLIAFLLGVAVGMTIRLKLKS